MARNKYDFIKEILESKKISPAQRERVLLLTKEEVKKDGALGKELEERVKKLEEKIKTESSSTAKNILQHNPQYISKYLSSKFRENNPLKWTTHVWDEKKYELIDTFITELNADKDYSEIFRYNRDLYNLINYFIYQPKIELDQNNIPKFGWPNLHDMKFGWQYPNSLIIDWCKANFDNKETDIKYPFQYELPEELRPKKPIKGKMISTFENVVDVFKTEIQFRDNYLYRELKKRTNAINDYKFIGIDDFKNLDFYTYAPGFLKAIDTILSEVKRNETEKVIQFSHKICGDELIIEITHLSSYPTRVLNTSNLSQFLGGGMNAIAGNTFSLCDFSVVTKFNTSQNKKQNGELMITYEGSEGEVKGNEVNVISQLKLIDCDNEPNGFTYKFKFYL
ncbi:MAG TPA: hypothetical protein PK047_09055 [Saprospiraceae bacterium]|nr:hypothetical protein [Saprospiraceae bacterium]HRO09003.1 hypothetical protein [Saprospiraceae bacterium]HRP42263.1 hypothetical protein [Saprospiraceae bacterium]